MNFQHILLRIKSNKASVLYVVSNIFLLIVGALKSYLILKFLNFSQVGSVATIQALIDLISLFHFGFISGAYRQYFSVPNEEKYQLNDFINTFFVIMLAALFSFGFIYSFFFQAQHSLTLLLVGYAGGVVLLSKNWVTNLLLANKEIRTTNILNNTGALLSLCFALMIFKWGIAAAILSIFSPTLYFIAIALFKYKYLQPRRFFFPFKIAVELLLIGVVPFLSGIFRRAIDQIERWGIINSFGIEELGKYNIVLIYSSTFLLVPYSIHSLFMPKIISAYTSGGSFRRQINLYALLNTSYCIVVFFSTYLFLEPVTKLLLPKYLPYINYVWYIFPFLLLSTLINVLDLYYTSVNKYRFMFWSYFIGTMTMSVLIYFITKYKNIEYVPIAKSLSILVIFIFGCIGIFKGRKF